MSNDDRDEDGFPIPCEANDGSVFVDEFEVAWVCEWIEGLSMYGWRSLGPVVEPPKED